MTAKERLAEMGDDLYQEGMAKHIEGVTLIQQSARLEQMARVLTEEMAQRALDAMRERRLESSACVQDALDILAKPRPPGAEPR